jgi:hypothetical protein
MLTTFTRGGVGATGCWTVRLAVADFVLLPVPVTVSVWVPVAVEPLVVTLSVEVAEPPLERLTELGPRLPVEFLGSPLSESEIMPSYPSTLATLMV